MAAARKCPLASFGWTPLCSPLNDGCGRAGGVGVECSGGGGADELVTIGTVDDSAAVKGCAAMLVDELQVDPRAALRFARARQGDFRKAKPFLQADLAWRAHKTPVMPPLHGFRRLSCLASQPCPCYRWCKATARRRSHLAPGGCSGARPQVRVHWPHDQHDHVPRPPAREGGGLGPVVL